MNEYNITGHLDKALHKSRTLLSVECIFLYFYINKIRELNHYSNRNLSCALFPINDTLKQATVI
jgi:hypothetical protein